MRSERDRIRRLLDRGEIILAEDLHERATGKARQIEFHRLREAREVGDDENRFAFILAEEGEHLRVFRMQEFSEPREKALKFFRIAITRRVHQRSDDKFFCWFSTLIAS